MYNFKTHSGLYPRIYHRLWGEVREGREWPNRVEKGGGIEVKIKRKWE